MGDLAKWKVRGLVKTLRTELAMWDPNREEWQPPKYSTITTFLPAGSVSTSDTHNPDGSVAHSRWLYDEANRLVESNFWLNDGPIERTVYFYDEAGRHQRTMREQTDVEICSFDVRGIKTKQRLLPLRGHNVTYGIEGTDQSYGAPGAVRMIITCDENDLPAKVVFEDANGNPVRDVTFERDSMGRLISEELHFGADSLLDKVPAEGREELAAELAKTLGEFFSRTTYAYDSRGRRLERTIKFGSLSESRTTWQYGDRDDPIAETTAERTSFEYIYDSQGNWTERIVPGSNIEHRIITYY
jgi:YD repeat-containing protein